MPWKSAALTPSAPFDAKWSAADEKTQRSPGSAHATLTSSSPSSCLVRLQRPMRRHRGRDALVVVVVASHVLCQSGRRVVRSDADQLGAGEAVAQLKSGAMSECAQVSDPRRRRRPCRDPPAAAAASPRVRAAPPSRRSRRRPPPSTVVCGCERAKDAVGGHLDAVETPCGRGGVEHQRERPAGVAHVVDVLSTSSNAMARRCASPPRRPRGRRGPCSARPGERRRCRRRPRPPQRHGSSRARAARSRCAAARRAGRWRGRRGRRPRGGRRQALPI